MPSEGEGTGGGVEEGGVLEGEGTGGDVEEGGRGVTMDTTATAALNEEGINRRPRRQIGRKPPKRLGQ